MPRKTKAGDYQPDPPDLPDEGASPERRQSAEDAATASERTNHPWRMLSALFERAVCFIVSLILSPLRFDLTPAVESMQEFPLARPFLLGMPEADLRERFNVTLVRATPSEFWLEFKPKHKKEQVRMERALLILNAADCIPKALQLVDSAGEETVHVFHNVSVVPWNAADPIPLPKGRQSLDRPDLSGYSPENR